MTIEMKHTHYRGVPLIEIVRQRDELAEALRYFIDKNTDAEPADKSEQARWNAQIDNARALLAKVGPNHST